MGLGTVLFDLEALGALCDELGVMISF
jgi:hypothetical protein